METDCIASINIYEMKWKLLKEFIKAMAQMYPNSDTYKNVLGVMECCEKVE